MKSIDCIFRETLVDGSFKIKSRVLVFIDEKGSEFSESFSEVYHNEKFESYQYDCEEFQFMQQMLEKIYSKKTLTKRTTYRIKRYICSIKLKT